MRLHVAFLHAVIALLLSGCVSTSSLTSSFERMTSGFWTQSLSRAPPFSFCSRPPSRALPRVLDIARCLAQFAVELVLNEAKEWFFPRFLGGGSHSTTSGGARQHPASGRAQEPLEAAL
jgi:hypothetical protein